MPPGAVEGAWPLVVSRWPSDVAPLAVRPLVWGLRSVPSVTSSLQPGATIKPPAATACRILVNTNECLDVRVKAMRESLAAPSGPRERWIRCTASASGRIPFAGVAYSRRARGPGTVRSLGCPHPIWRLSLQ